MKSKSPHEKVLQKALLQRASSAIADLYLFERECIFAQVGKTKRIIGTPGQCDLWGFWQGGLHIEIELKSVNGRLSEEQTAWKQFCLQRGVPHLVLQAWTGETTEQTVTRWCQKILSTRPSRGKVVLQIAPRPSKADSADFPSQVTWLPHARKDIRKS